MGGGEITEALKSNPAPDFGLKGGFEWVDKLMQILDTQNLFEREQKIDLLRWEMVEEFTVYEYFNIALLMNYLIKVNIIDRWNRLDPALGDKMFRKLIDELKIPQKEY
jgi:hypothetical protein